MSPRDALLVDMLRERWNVELGVRRYYFRPVWWNIKKQNKPESQTRRTLARPTLTKDRVNLHLSASWLSVKRFTLSHAHYYNNFLCSTWLTCKTPTQLWGCIASQIFNLDAFCTRLYSKHMSGGLHFVYCAILHRLDPIGHTYFREIIQRSTYRVRRLARPLNTPSPKWLMEFSPRSRLSRRPSPTNAVSSSLVRWLKDKSLHKTRIMRINIWKQFCI